MNIFLFYHKEDKSIVFYEIDSLKYNVYTLKNILVDRIGQEI